MENLEAGLFENLAADDSDERLAERKALAAISKRVNDRFGAFLAAAESSDEQRTRLALIEDDLREEIDSVVSEYGGDPNKIEASLRNTIVRPTKQHSRVGSDDPFDYSRPVGDDPEWEQQEQYDDPEIHSDPYEAPPLPAHLQVLLDHAREALSQGDIEHAQEILAQFRQQRDEVGPGGAFPDELYGGDEDFGREGKVARRPKLCPYHSEVMDISLTSGDPQAGFNAMSQHAWGPQHCQGGEYEGRCNFKPEMVTQDYWDKKAEQAEERKQQREQELQLEQQPLQPVDEAVEPSDAPEEEGINEELAEAPSAIGDGSEVETSDLEPVAARTADSYAFDSDNEYEVDPGYIDDAGWEACPDCGQQLEPYWNYCPFCGYISSAPGRSARTADLGLAVEHYKCKECDGTGKKDGEKCEACNGSGTANEGKEAANKLRAYAALKEKGVPVPEKLESEVQKLAQPGFGIMDALPDPRQLQQLQENPAPARPQPPSAGGFMSVPGTGYQPIPNVPKTQAPNTKGGQPPLSPNQKADFVQTPGASQPSQVPGVNFTGEAEKLLKRTPGIGSPLGGTDKVGEALETVDLPAAGPDGLSDKGSPEIKKEKSGDERGWKLTPIDTEMSGSPHPVEQQDPETPAEYDNRSFLDQTDAVTESQELPTANEEGHSTEKNIETVHTDTWGENNNAAPVTQQTDADNLG